MLPLNKYYDIYMTGTNNMEYSRGILGDATKEMGPFYDATYGNIPGRPISSWYNDHLEFVYSTYPWVERGGCYYFGVEGGIFDSNLAPGNLTNYTGFRLVLTPNL